MAPAATRHVFGTFLMTQACVPLLHKSKNGRVINFVGGGEGAMPNFSAYVASKGAIARLNETMAQSSRIKGIMVMLSRLFLLIRA